MQESNLFEAALELRDLIVAHHKLLKIWQCCENIDIHNPVEADVNLLKVNELSDVVRESSLEHIVGSPQPLQSCQLANSRQGADGVETQIQIHKGAEIAHKVWQLFEVIGGNVQTAQYFELAEALG